MKKILNNLGRSLVLLPVGCFGVGIASHYQVWKKVLLVGAVLLVTAFYLKMLQNDSAVILCYSSAQMS